MAFLRMLIGFVWTGAGYDGRHNSRAFALVAARVFNSKGYRVHMLEGGVPTPLVPFTLTMKVSISSSAFFCCDFL